MRLTDAEDRICTWVGKMRFQNRQQAKGRDGLGNGPSKEVYGPDLAIRGAKAECACAKMLNLYWSPIVEFYEREPDVGGFVEVRSITKPDHRLIVKPWEKDHPFALIYTDGTNYSFRGWMMASEARMKGTFHEYPDTDPAHYVEQHQLRSQDDLGGR